MKLRDVKMGETVRVVKIAGEGATKRRIMDMGITKGTDIFVRKVAPLGDPVEVTVRNFELHAPLVTNGEIYQLRLPFAVEPLDLLCVRA